MLIALSKPTEMNLNARSFYICTLILDCILHCDKGWNSCIGGSLAITGFIGNKREIFSILRSRYGSVITEVCMKIWNASSFFC